MSPPLVSVVIPTFNRSSTIVASIESVQCQTFKDFEIIVVDDGSTDQTEQVLNELDVPGLRYIRHSENRGANAARNTGAGAALGEFVAFQDSDDTWHYEKLQKQVHACRHFNAAVSFCAFNRIKDGIKTIVPKPGYKIQPGCHNMHAALLRGSFISCQTLLIRRELLLLVGMFDENLPRLQDWDLCLRLSEKYPFAYINEPLVEVTIQSDSISQGTTNYARAADLILIKYSSAFSNDKVAAAILCINIAADALRSRRLATFGRYLAKAMCQGVPAFYSSLAILAGRR